MSLVSDTKNITVGLVNEFKTFVAKGNVSVIIGAAFGDIVKSMVKDVITPLIGMVGGKPDFSSIHLGPILIGNFINAVVSFLILAAVVFFVLVKPMNHLMTKLKKAEVPPPTPSTPEDVLLLREIRDALKSK